MSINYKLNMQGLSEKKSNYTFQRSKGEFSFYIINKQQERNKWFTYLSILYVYMHGLSYQILAANIGRFTYFYKLGYFPIPKRIFMNISKFIALFMFIYRYTSQ